MADDPERLSADRVWIIDLLDGTPGYRESRTDWAVHVAMWADGALRAGAVALPTEARVFTSEPAPQRAPPSAGRPRVLVSRRLPAGVQPSRSVKPRVPGVPTGTHRAGRVGSPTGRQLAGHYAVGCCGTTPDDEAVEDRRNAAGEIDLAPVELELGRIRRHIACTASRELEDVARAFAHRPLTSRASHTSIDVSRWTSMSPSSGCNARTPPGRQGEGT